MKPELELGLFLLNRAYFGVTGLELLKGKNVVNSLPVNFSGILTSDAHPQSSEIYFSESSNHPPCFCFRFYSGRQ